MIVEFGLVFFFGGCNVVLRLCYICGCRNTIINNVSYRRSIPRRIWCVCVCVCNTSITDIEKWIEYSQLTWLEHLFTRTSTFWWYTIHLSIWVELCVTAPSEKLKLIPHLFSWIRSHPSFTQLHVISFCSRLFTRELKTVGVKRQEVTPPETEKGLAPLDC